jgi:hypothetical protein
MVHGKQATEPATKGIGSLLNMDRFTVLRQLRTRRDKGEINEEEYNKERMRILNKSPGDADKGEQSIPICMKTISFF